MSFDKSRCQAGRTADCYFTPNPGFEYNGVPEARATATMLPSTGPTTNFAIQFVNDDPQYGTDASGFELLDPASKAPVVLAYYHPSPASVTAVMKVTPVRTVTGTLRGSMVSCSGGPKPGWVGERTGMQLLLWQDAVIAVAGMLAGTINAVVGSGTLITFPVLLAFGFPPVTANVSNGLGLVPGSLSGAYGYRRELEGQRSRLVKFGIASALGAVCGAVLLLKLPANTFQAVVPILIVIALVLVVIQPWLARKLAARNPDRPTDGGLALWLGIFATGVYGGYFGAAQGVIAIGLMGVLLSEPMQRINGAKNVLTALANLVSGIVFIFFAHVAWLAVLLIAVGSMVGGLIGARIGRKLPPIALRAVIVLVGLAAIAKLLLT